MCLTCQDFYSPNMRFFYVIQYVFIAHLRIRWYYIGKEKEVEYMSTIGNRIKQCRLAAGLSVDELAEKLHKNRATVYRYENDDIKDLPITILEPLAQALNTSPAYLLGWNKSNDADNKSAKEPALTDDELKLLSNYRKLNNTGKTVAQGSVEALTTQEQFCTKVKSDEAI